MNEINDIKIILDKDLEIMPDFRLFAVDGNSWGFDEWGVQKFIFEKFAGMDGLIIFHSTGENEGSSTEDYPDALDLNDKLTLEDLEIIKQEFQEQLDFAGEKAKIIKIELRTNRPFYLEI